MMQRHVKFVPFNEYTIQHLMNKTIKFSNVYEFNDFNELNYICSPSIKKDPVKEKLCKELQKKLKDPHFTSDVFQKLPLSGCYDEDYIIELEKRLQHSSTEIKDDDLPILTEHLAFASVGIFSVSDCSVFQDDAAQLMFAHYSDNLKGLALIYQYNKNNIHKITYDLAIRSSCGLTSRIIPWINGQYNDMEDFLYKSKYWSYEKESRIFSKPGIHDAEQCGMQLYAIFYTARFPKEKIDMLNKINKCIYDDKLKIEKIRPNHSKPKFVIDPLDI